MRFIIGVITGVAIGAVAATATAGSSGKEIRRDIERIRRDIERRDFDAAGARIEKRFNDFQATIEAKFAQASDAAEGVVDDAQDAVDEAADVVADAAEDATDGSATA